MQGNINGNDLELFWSQFEMQFPKDEINLNSNEKTSDTRPELVLNNNKSNTEMNSNPFMLDLDNSDLMFILPDPIPMFSGYSAVQPEEEKFTLNINNKRNFEDLNEEIPSSNKKIMRQRSSSSSFCQQSTGSSTGRVVDKWTSEEDDRLSAAVQRFSGKHWKKISGAIGGTKTHIQCLQRWKQVLQPGIVKGNWTPEEDERLKQIMQTFLGDSPVDKKFDQWKKVEEQMLGRTAKQCRERWVLSLDPSINRSEWSAPEDRALLDLQSELGNCWSMIKDTLETNRTENAVKLRYNYLARLKAKHGEEFLDHVDYEGGSKTGNPSGKSKLLNRATSSSTSTSKQVTAKTWSPEDDFSLIFGIKYLGLQPNDEQLWIVTNLDRNKFDYEVQKRWIYLTTRLPCLMHRPLVNITEHGMNRVEMYAREEAEAVLGLVSDVTPTSVPSSPRYHV